MDSDDKLPPSLSSLRPQLRLLRGEAVDSTKAEPGRQPSRDSIPLLGRSAPSIIGDRAAQLRDAYVFGAKLLLSQPAACTKGYRLFWVHGRDLGWLDLAASSAVYAVLGWHDNCDLQLPKLPGIANRQMLASCFLLKDGTPALRLLDLQTGEPFTLEGEPRESLCASGPLLLGLGESACALGCVPLPEFHEQRGALADGVELPTYTTSSADHPPDQSMRQLRRSHITLMPVSVRVQDLPMPEAAPPGFARISLQRNQRAVSIEVSEQDLYAGVMIGRAETCMDRGLRQVLSGQISRLHLLLLAERGRVYAMDLCSTNGTWLEGRRVRRIQLLDQGMRLLLSGRDSKVELTWHPRDLHSAPRHTLNEYLRKP